MFTTNVAEPTIVILEPRVRRIQVVGTFLLRTHPPTTFSTRPTVQIVDLPRDGTRVLILLNFARANTTSINITLATTVDLAA